MRFVLPALLLLAACDASLGEDPNISPLATRLSDTRLTLNVVGPINPGPIVLELYRDGTMTSRLQGKTSRYAWSIRKNQFCTAALVGRQVVPNTEECGTVAIKGDAITLRQITSTTGSGDVLTGRIAPL